MKDLIKKILREETSGFDPKMLRSLYKFMELQTKNYVWYYDTPEKRFEMSPESIWLINPKTGQWVIELEKSGRLWWYVYLYENFQRYFNMEQSDFEKFIKIWVEDVLNRGVSTTSNDGDETSWAVEDVLNRGVSTTPGPAMRERSEVEDVLNRGVSTTTAMPAARRHTVGDVLNKGKKL